MEFLIETGGCVKALGDGRVAGMLIPFGSPEAVDTDNEFFARDTDYDQEFPVKVSTYYDHGMDSTLGKRRLTRAKASVTDSGVWLEDQLDLSDEYQAKIYALAEAGRLGLSSGSVAHLVERERAGKAYKITKWPLAEASYTVRPANPRTLGVMPMKSWCKDRVAFEDATKAEEAPPQEPASEPEAAPTDLSLSQPEEMVSVSVDEQAAKVVSAAAELGKRLGDDGLWAKIQPPEEPEPDTPEPIDWAAEEVRFSQLSASLSGALFSC
jgi:phage head maturation protease